MESIIATLAIFVELVNHSGGISIHEDEELSGQKSRIYKKWR